MGTRQRPTAPDVQSPVHAYPTSFAQERLWFLDQMTPGNPFYNLPLAIRIDAPVNAVALQRALNECARRHEVLRTSFAVLDGQPRQVIAPSVHVDCPVIDLRHLTGPAQDKEVARLATEEAARPFDLRIAPLLRAVVLRLGARAHVLLLTMHHIISDDWSLEILWREVASCYAAFLAGRPSPLPPLRIQYLDYAVLQREWLEGDVLDEQLRYWTRELANLSRLELRTDRPRPTVATYRGAYEPVNLDAALSERLRDTARAEHCTLFMVLLAAFQAVLARYTRQHDIAVGVPITNRNRPELEALIGFFVNTLVIRTDLSGSPSFAEILRRVKAKALAAYAHQDLPFERLVQKLHPERDLSRNPLVQVTIQLQQPRTGIASPRGVAARPLDIDRGTAIFDVAVRLWESSTGLQGGIEYSTDLFDRVTIRRFIGAYRHVLDAVVRTPNLRLAEIPLMSDDEARGLVAAWNENASIRRETPAVHQLFAAQASRTPDAPAVVFGARTLSYRELLDHVKAWADNLRATGVATETLVGIALERSPELVIAMLACLECRAAYVPLDPSYPAERLAGMIRRAKLGFVIASDAASAILPRGDAQLLSVEALSASTVPRRAASAAPVRPDDLAYVIHTSGSTGTPKGVAISHGALTNHMQWMQARLPIGPGDRVLQKTPIGFDASVWEFYAPLISGATLVIARPERHMDGAFLVAEILANRVSVIQLVPSLLKLCLDDARFGQCRCLRRVFCGGEPLGDDLARRFHDAGLGAELHNLYGPSEATIDAIVWKCPREARSNVAIGRPIDGMAAYILDGSGRPLPVGVPGELFVAGAGLGRGYLHAPDLTAERFVPNPFGLAAGERMYRTGDLAVYRNDGEFEFLGRVDAQMKIRGMRIEPAEIETTLREHPGVRDAAVVVREDSPGDPRLVAYLVARAGSVPSGRDLRAFLAGRLPEQMIPSLWVAVDRLPLGPNGKLDRRMLPKPAGDAFAARPYVAPRTPLEERLVEIWARTLRVPRVGVDDNFFELGGHSLLATQLVSRVRETFHIDLPLRHIFHAPTPAELASVVESIVVEEVAAMSDTETARLVGTGESHV